MKNVFFILVLTFISFSSDAACKKCIKYAVSDASGAYTGFTLGSGGGPMGSAMGIVLGGLINSSYAYWLDNGGPRANPGENSSNNSCCVRELAIDRDKSSLNSYELSGYNHNDGLFYVIDNLKNLTLSEQEGFDLIYNKSIDFVSNEYNQTVSNLKTYYPKDHSYDILIKNNNIEDPIFNNFITTLNSIEGDNELISYFDNKFNEIQNNNDLDNLRKERLLHSIKVCKFSYIFWSKNITN
jgi:hypothetical protein